VPGAPPTSLPPGEPASPVAPVALVTGAARGIGRAVALALARAGWQLCLLDACRPDPALSYPLASLADLHASAAACAETGSRVLARPVDVRDQQSLREAVSDISTAFGRLDAVVAAAGALAGGPPLWELADEQWTAMVEINLAGVFRTLRAALPAMLASPPPRRGRVVVLASAASSVGLPRLGAYAAAKHGVVGLVKSLAIELAGTGITANCVAPGTTATVLADASAAVYGLTDPAELAQHHAEPRLLEPAEVAALVAWLCGPEASGVTGALLPCDLGMTAR